MNLTFEQLAQLLQNGYDAPPASRIYIEEETRVTQTALLLYDLRNSCPRGTAFAPGQRVAFEGVTYRVQTVETLLENNRPHHVEVLLTT